MVLSMQQAGKDAKSLGKIFSPGRSAKRQTYALFGSVMTERKM